MDLILASTLTLVGTVVGALMLGCIRGIASRAEGKMARVLDGIPNASDRERWQEELRRILLEFEGRPVKQFRESKELVRAAKRLVEIYKPSSEQREVGGQEPTDAPKAMAEIARKPSAVAPAAQMSRSALIEAMENLSYRERRILELRYGLGGEPQYSAEEVGKKFNVQTDRIGQIESQALKKIQQLIEAQKLRESV